MKVFKAFNRTLSVLLVAAMVATSTPDVCFTAYAAEDEEVTEEVTAQETVPEDAIEVVAEDDIQDTEESIVSEDDVQDTEESDTTEEDVQDTEESDTAEELEEATSEEEITEETTSEEEITEETTSEEVISEEATSEEEVIAEEVISEEETSEEETTDVLDMESAGDYEAFDAQLSTIDFGVNTANDDSAEVKITVTTAETGKTLEYAENGKWSTNASKVSFTVDAVAGFEVTGISINGEAVELSYDQLDTMNGVNGFTDAANKTFTINNLNETKGGKITYTDAAVVITTIEKPIETPRKVYFSNKDPENVTYTFQNLDTEYTGSTDFSMEAGATKLNFDVIVRGAYEPTVTTNDVVCEPVSVTAVSSIKTVYSYSLVAEQVANGQRFTIDTEVSKNTITFKYDDRYITKVVVYDKNDERFGNATLVEYANNDIYTIECVKNDVAKVIVTTQNGYLLDNKEFELIGDNTYELYIKALTENLQIVLNVTALTSTQIREVNGDVPGHDEKTDEWKVIQNVAYEIIAEVAGQPVEFTGVEFVGISVAEEAKPAVAQDKHSVKFVVPAAAAGKTFTVKATYMSGEKEVAVSYKLKVDKAVTSVTVNGVKNGELSRTIATTAAYAVKMTGATDYSILWAEVENPTTGDVAAADMDASGKLLNIATTGIEGEATVKIYGVGEVDEEGKNRVLAEFKVHTVKPELNMQKVDLVSALHDGFIIRPTAGKLTTEDYNEDYELAYIVEVEKPVTGKYEVDSPYVFSKTNKAASENVHITFDVTEPLEEPAAYGVSTKLALVKWEGRKYTILAESNAVENTFSTKAPYYEDKLTLIKKTTTIYSGQKSITVAVPKFGKNTTFQEGWDCEVTVYDSEGRIAPYDGVYPYYDAKTNEVKVTVGKYVDKATYTIKVAPYANEGETMMYAEPASIKINIVQGIYKLKVSPDSAVNIYKAANKPGTYALSVIYNDGDVSCKPNKAAVEASIIAANDYSAGIENYVTYKNGKITVDKKYQVKDDPRANQFKIELRAADYEGNETSCTSGIFTVSQEKTELGKMYLARLDETENIYNVVSKPSYTTDELEDIKFIVVKKGVAQKAYYEADDLVDRGLYDITISNKKIDYYSDNTLEINHVIGKNIKITATSTDGGKQKSVLTFTTTYNTDELVGKMDTTVAFDVKWDEDYGHSVIYLVGHDDEGFLGISEKDGVYHYNSASADDMLYFMVETVEDKWDSEATYNYSVSVSGGKILNSDKYYGYYDIFPTAQKTVVTLQDKTNKAKKTYTFVNDSYVKTKAPSVTVEKKNLYAGYDKEQTVTLYFSNPGNKYSYAYVSGDEEDFAKSDGEKWDTYYGLSGMLLVNFNDNEDYTDKQGNYAGEKYILTIPEYAAAGNYKLNVVYGSYDEPTQSFVRETAKRPVTVNVKKAVNFKPTKSYTIDPTVGFTVVTGTPADQVNEAYVGAELRNANINGMPNHFCDYFALVGNKLVIKGKVDDKGNVEPYTAEELATIVGADKNAFTGYISYTDLKTGNTEWAQIKVNVKPARYTANDINAFANDKNASGTTKIVKSWSAASIAYAYAESEGKITFNNNQAVVVNGSDITLTTDSVPEAGRYKVNLYVVDSASEAYKNLGAKAANEDIKKYGTLVTLNFNVSNPNAKNKLAFNRKSIVFDEYDYDTETLGWVIGNSSETGFKLSNGAQIESIAVAEQTPDYITIEPGKVSGGAAVTTCDWVKVTVDKAKLRAANEAAKKSILGTKINVTVNVNFKNGLAAESYKLTVTLPKTIQTYAEGLEAVEKGYVTRLAGLNLASFDSAAKLAAELAIGVESLVHRESGLSVIVEPVSFQPSTAKDAGCFIANISVINADKGATDKATTFSNVKLTIPVQNTAQTLEQAKKAIDDAFDEIWDDVTLDTTKEDILAIAQSVVTNPNIEVRYALWNGWNVTESTEDVYGYLKASIKLSRSIFSRKTCTLSKTFSRLDRLIEATSKITKALNDSTNKNLYGVKNEADIIAAAKAAFNNPAINVAFGEKDGEKCVLTPATATAAGKFSGTLYVTQEGKREKTIEFTNATLPKPDNAANGN